MSVLPSTSSMALKEWAVAVNAMATGEQIVTLRKGGIHRDDLDLSDTMAYTIAIDGWLYCAILLSVLSLVSSRGSW